MSSPTPAEVAEALGINDQTELFDAIAALEEYIAFNRVLGLEFVELSSEKASFSLTKRPELIGNAQKQALHGGVISATLDAVGGMVAMAALVERADSAEQAVASMMRVGTIDLRIDYLRPATEERYLASAHPLRIGRTVAVTRMELHDDRDRQVAVGTGTYIVG